MKPFLIFFRMIKENICDKVDRINRMNKLKKFNSAMSALFDEYKSTDAYCTWKMSFMKGGSTFDSFDHKDESHPLHPCVKCSDYFVNSGCNNYKSKTLFDLKRIGAIPDSYWRLK